MLTIILLSFLHSCNQWQVILLLLFLQYYMSWRPGNAQDACVRYFCWPCFGKKRRMIMPHLVFASPGAFLAIVRCICGSCWRSIKLSMRALNQPTFALTFRLSFYVIEIMGREYLDYLLFYVVLPRTNVFIVINYFQLLTDFQSSRLSLSIMWAMRCLLLQMFLV